MVEVEEGGCACEGVWEEEREGEVEERVGMGGRTATPRPGRERGGWPCGRVAIRFSAL